MAFLLIPAGAVIVGFVVGYEWKTKWWCTWWIDCEDET